MVVLQTEQATRIDTLSSELTTLRGEILTRFGDLKGEIDKNMTQIDALEHEIDGNLAEIDTLKEKIEGTLAKIDTLEGEIKDTTGLSHSVIDAHEVYQQVSQATVRISNGERTVGSGFIFDFGIFSPFSRAKVAELVDARDLGSRGLGRGGSSPPFRIISEQPRKHPHHGQFMAIDPSTLRVDLEEQEAWRRRITVTVPAPSVQSERNKILAKMGGRLKLPGFRKGKVPAQVVEKRFGPAVDQELMDKVIGEAYRAALKAHSLEPISEGNVEEIKYQPREDLTFTISFDVQPVIELSRLDIELEGTIVFKADSPGTDGAAIDEIYIEILPDEVRAELNNTNVKITIPVATRSSGGEVLAVPAAALSATGSGDTIVTVENEDGSTRVVRVTPGLSAPGGMVEVTPLDGELNEGDRVVVGFQQGSGPTTSLAPDEE